MDKIFIETLETQAIIGIYDWERSSPQPLYFDIELSLPIFKAAQSDHINDTVDYKQVCDELIELVATSRVELLESLVEKLCDHIFLNHRAVQKIKLKVSKPQAVSATKTVGLMVSRTRVN